MAAHTHDPAPVSRRCQVCNKLPRVRHSSYCLDHRCAECKGTHDPCAAPSCERTSRCGSFFCHQHTCLRCMDGVDVNGVDVNGVNVNGVNACRCRSPGIRFDIRRCQATGFDGVKEMACRRPALDDKSFCEVHHILYELPCSKCGCSGMSDTKPTARHSCRQNATCCVDSRYRPRKYSRNKATRCMYHQRVHDRAERRRAIRQVGCRRGIPTELVDYLLSFLDGRER